MRGVTMMQETSKKIQSAIEIFKTQLSGAKGKFRAFVSATNSNEVEFFCEAGLYCIINIKSAKIRAI